MLEPLYVEEKVLEKPEIETKGQYCMLFLNGVIGTSIKAKSSYSKVNMEPAQWPSNWVLHKAMRVRFLHGTIF